jgi:Amt family ammonium transporter
MGGVSLISQVIGTLLGIVVASLGGLLIYGVLKMTVGIRLDPEEEYDGADLSIHKITATPEREVSW